MEGFEKPDTRRDFAAHCALDPGILESWFITISRLVDEDVGACWCECRTEQDDTKRFGNAYEEEEDDWRPLMLTPIVEHGNQSYTCVFTDGPEKADQLMKRKKRKRLNLTEVKRWPSFLRPHHGKETD